MNRGEDRALVLPGYTVLERLSDGPAGIELKARLEATGAMVTILVYPQGQAELPGAFRRFIPHFESLRKTFSFERVLRIREMGVRDDVCYCISDYVEGYTVADWLKRKGLLDESDVMLVGQYAAVGLAHVWNVGRLVHGDLKPTDLLVAEAGDVKLRYFSSYVSVMAAARHSGLARPGGRYAAPEVRHGLSAPTPQSDMYALGMVLLHLLTGVPPPVDLVPTVPGSAANMVLTGGISVSRPMTMLLRKLTAADPLTRYHDWSGLLADLALVEKGRSPDIGSSVASESRRFSGNRRPRTRNRFSPRRVLWTALGCSLVCACAVLVSYHLEFREALVPPKPNGSASGSALSDDGLMKLLRPAPTSSHPPSEPSVPDVVQDHSDRVQPGTPEPPPPPAVVVALPWEVPAECPAEGLEDYVLIMHDVIELGAKRRFEEGRAMLDQWLAMNPDNPYCAHVSDEKRRIDMVMAAFDRVLEARMLVRGALIEAQPGLRGAVADVRDGQLWVVLKYEHGEVEVGAPLQTVTEQDFATLLRRVSPETYAEDMSLYLAAGGQVDALEALVKKEGVAGSLLTRVQGLVRNRQHIVDNLAALDLLARIRQFVDAGLHATAHDMLVDARRTCGATVVFSQLRRADIALLEQRIADGTAELKKVLTGGNEFTVATLGKPDRRAKLELAFKTALEQGRWSEYVALLESALFSALKTRGSLSPVRQYERVLAEATLRNALNQAAFVHVIGPERLGGFAVGASERAFLQWLLRKDAALEGFLRTVKPEDDISRVMRVWQKLWDRDPEHRDKYFNLALACAVVFDDPVYASAATGSDSESARTSDPSGRVPDVRSRYDFYRISDLKKRLRVQVAQMPASELVWVVDAPVPESELRWAQIHVNYSRREWGRAYGHIQYRMDKARGELDEPLYREYTLEQIEKRGGVCSDQAYFCVMSAKANGIPAMIISGDGQRGLHAWAGYKASEKEWDLDTGRYGGYPVGTTRDPQTGKMIRGWELSMLADPQLRAAAGEQSHLYLRLAELFARHARLDEAREAFRMALDISSRQPRTWEAYIAFMKQTDAAVEEWEDVVAELRQTYRDYPDMLAYADKIEEEMVFAHLDPSKASKALRSRIKRMDRRQGDRTDLLRETIRRQASILERGGDVDGALKTYEEALGDLAEEKVSFMELSNNLFALADRYGRRHEAMRIIDRAFRRHYRGSHGDYFYMKEYQKMLVWLAGLHERDGSESEADRYRREADRIGRRL